MYSHPHSFLNPNNPIIKRAKLQILANYIRKNSNMFDMTLVCHNNKYLVIINIKIFLMSTILLSYMITKEGRVIEEIWKTKCCLYYDCEDETEQSTVPYKRRKNLRPSIKLKNINTNIALCFSMISHTATRVYSEFTLK